MAAASTMSDSTAVSARANVTESSSEFQFPDLYGFPPFFDIQPVVTTRTHQLQTWSDFIQSYCKFHRIWTFTLVDALSTPLFYNTRLSRGLKLQHARKVIQWMTTPEGGNRAEWISTTGANAKKKAGEEDEGAGKCWVYWKRPEEWATALEEWVDRTGQKGTVLTLYEITDSDATRREDFYGMDAELLSKSLAICVKRGKAQIFGESGSEGVKFF